MEEYQRQFTTLCSGPTFSASRSLTNKDLLHVCSILDSSFNSKYWAESASSIAPDQSYHFEPEIATEGGILMTRWPGKTGNQYKTMRIYFSQYPSLPHIYKVDPIIIHHVRQADDEGIAQARASRELVTCLKAFGNAPAWTTSEIDLFSTCLAHIGVTVRKKVSKKWLNHYTKRR